MLKLPFMEQISRFCKSWVLPNFWHFSNESSLKCDLNLIIILFVEKIKIIYKYWSKIASSCIHFDSAGLCQGGTEQCHFSFISIFHFYPCLPFLSLYILLSQEVCTCVSLIPYMNCTGLLKSVCWRRNGAHTITPLLSCTISR